MTTKATPDEDVQAVLDDLDIWTSGSTELLHYSGVHMFVKIDLGRMKGLGIADLLEWLIHQDWSLHFLDLSEETAKMSGQPYEVE